MPVLPGALGLTHRQESEHDRDVRRYPAEAQRYLDNSRGQGADCLTVGLPGGAQPVRVVRRGPIGLVRGRERGPGIPRGWRIARWLRIPRRIRRRVVDRGGRIDRVPGLLQGRVLECPVRVVGVVCHDAATYTNTT